MAPPDSPLPLFLKGSDVALIMSVFADHQAFDQLYQDVQQLRPTCQLSADSLLDISQSLFSLPPPPPTAPKPLSSPATPSARHMYQPQSPWPRAFF